MTLDQPVQVRVALKGELDLARWDELEQLGAIACDSDLAIVDMTEVTFLDSTVLNWLVHTKQALEQKSGRLRVIAPSGIVTRLVSIAGLEGVIEVFPTHFEAHGA